MKCFARVLLLIITLIFSTHLLASTENRSAIFPGINASDGKWEGAISVTWETVAGTDIYQVYRSTTPSSLGTLIFETTTARSYADYEITANVTYYYQLLVCSVDMCIYHEAYDDGYALPVTTPAPPPSYLNATDGDYYNKVVLNWQIVTGTLYYKLYRSSSADQVGGLIYQSNYRTQISYTDTTVTPGVTHYYRIQSCISTSCSGYSTIETGYAAQLPAPPPSFLNASDGDYFDKVYLEWELVSGADYYKLYRSSSADQVGGLVYQSNDNTDVSYFDMTVTPGVTHYYRIQSCIYESCSGYGNVESGYAASADTATLIASQLANASWPVNGYFIRSGTGAFDWIYVTPNASLVAKLEGMNESSGNLLWKIIQTSGTKAFDSVSAFTIVLDDVVSTSVMFGNYIGNDPELNTIGTQLENQHFPIAGYFIHYGSGAYDWVYVLQDTTIVAKLEGMNPETKYFLWNMLQTREKKAFSSINIVNNGTWITFGGLQ